MSEDFRRYTSGSTRQLIDYNRFMSLTGEKVFLCLDRGVLEIAKYFLNSRGGWRTSYVKEYGPVGYIMPTEEEFQNITQAIAEANIDMASCDDIITALNGIRDAIGSTSGSTGGCCPIDGNTDVTDVNDGESESVPEGESYPDGFSSREEYDDYRCKAAYYIIRGYIGTLRNWAGLFGTLGGLTLAVITGLLLLTVPPAGLILIMAALGILVGSDFALLAVLSDIAQGIEDDIDALACEVYNATSTEDAAEAIRDKAYEVILALAPPLEITFKQVTDNLISNDQCEVLITNNPTIATLPEEDCSACSGIDCEPCSEAEMFIWTDIGNQGTITSTTPGANSVTYDVSSGTYQGGTIDFYLSTDSNPSNQCNQLVTITVTSGTITPADPVGWRTWNALGELTYSGDTPPPTGFPICVSNVSIRSSTPFTIEVIAEW